MAAAKGDGVHPQACIALQGDGGLGDAGGRGEGTLQAVELHIGTFAHIEPQAHVGQQQVGLAVAAEQRHILAVAEHHPQLASGLDSQLADLARRSPVVAPNIGQLVFPNHNLNSKH